MGVIISIIGLVLSLVCLLLTFCFPVYLAVFLYHLLKKRSDRLHYLTMVLYCLFFLISLGQQSNYLDSLAYWNHSEAKTNLGALYSAQVAYFGKYSTYAHGSNCFADLGWSPEGDTYITYYCGSDIFAPTQAGRDPAPFRPNTNWPSSVPKPEASSTSFTMVAIGNLDHDPDFNIWVINDKKILANPVNDVDIISISSVRNMFFENGRHDVGSGLILFLLAPLLIISLIRDAAKARKG